MRGISRRGLPVLALLLLSGCGADPTPVPFQSTAGNFRARMPANPEKQEQTIGNGPGVSVVLHGFVKRVSGNLEFQIAYCDYPETAPDLPSARALLQNVADGQAQAFNGMLTDRKSVAIGGHPGLAYDVVHPVGVGNTQYLRVRTFLVRNRLYQLVVACPQRSTQDPNVDIFLNSFELITNVDLAWEPARTDEPLAGRLARIAPVLDRKTRRVLESTPKGAAAKPVERPAPAKNAATALSSPSAAKPGPQSEPASPFAKARLVSFAWLDEDDDQTGSGGDSEPDGKLDMHLRTELELPTQTEIESIAVTEGPINHWTTLDQDGHWPIAVLEGGEVVTRKHAKPVGVFSGRRTFDLYTPHWFDAKPGAEFKLTIRLRVAGAEEELVGTCASTPTPVADADPGPEGDTSGGAAIVRFEHLGNDEDLVAEGGGPMPDGKNDMKFLLELDLPQNVEIREIRVTDGGGNYWTTLPSDRWWPVGVYRDGKEITRKHIAKVGVHSGLTVFQLYTTHPGGMGPGTELSAHVILRIDGKGRHLLKKCRTH